MHVQAACGAARLPAPREVHAAHGPLHRAAQVRVGIDDHRVLAAQLQQGALHRVRGGPQHGLAGADASDKRDGGHIRVRGQRGTRLASASDAVQHPRGEQAVQDLHQPDGRQRRLFRRLEDDRVARRERRGDLACREHERVVEREDPCDGAERLPERVVQRAVRGRDGLALDLKHQSREIVQLGGRDLRVHLHCTHGIAAVGGVQQRQFPRMQPHAARGLPQQRRALQGRGLGPGREGGLRRGDRGVDLRRTRRGHVGQTLARGRVEGRDRLVRSFMPAAVPEQPARPGQDSLDVGAQVAAVRQDDGGRCHGWPPCWSSWERVMPEAIAAL